MKINHDKVEERLSGVPDNKRSHIYNASIVLEFLVQTFMPTRFFLPPGFSPTPGTPLGQKSMRKISEGKEMSIGDLYNLYQLFREEKDYTARIESRYIFGIIIRNLRYYKNAWEFTTWRVGTAQIWHVGPLQLRSDIPADVRAKFAPKLEEKSVEATTVEADPVADPEVIGIDEGIPGGDSTVEVHGHTTPEGDVEITKIVVDPDRFKEAKFEIDVQVEPPAADEGY